MNKVQVEIEESTGVRAPGMIEHAAGFLEWARLCARQSPADTVSFAEKQQILGATTVWDLFEDYVRTQIEWAEMEEHQALEQKQRQKRLTKSGLRLATGNGKEGSK